MSDRQAVELALEGAEVLFKQTVENGLLKDIPIVGTLAKLHDIGSSIRDRLYAAKVGQFLSSLEEVSKEDKERFREAIRTGSEEANRLSGKIFLVLETQTDLEKSEIIANLFLAYLDKQISSADFRRAVDVTAAAFLDDLKEFLKGDGFHGFMHEKYEDLERRGIAALINTPLIGVDQTTTTELRRDGWRDEADLVLYESTSFGGAYQNAYHYGRRLRLQGEDRG